MLAGGGRQLKYLLLDTNIFVTCTLTRIEYHDAALLRKLQKALEQGAARLLLPEVIEDEYWRVEQQEFEKLLHDKNEAIELVQRLFPRRKTNRDLVGAIEDEIRECKENRDQAHAIVKEVFNSQSTVRLPITPGILHAAYQRTRAGLRPAKPVKRYLVDDDSVIVESLIEFFRHHHGDELVICTDNAKDFFQDNALHPDIAQDLSVNTRCYTKLPQLIRKELDVRVSKKQEEAYLKGSARLQYMLDFPALATAVGNVSASMLRAAQPLAEFLDKVSESFRGVEAPLRAFQEIMQASQPVADFTEMAEQLRNRIAESMTLYDDASRAIAKKLQDLETSFRLSEVASARLLELDSVLRSSPAFALASRLADTAPDSSTDSLTRPFGRAVLEAAGFEGFIPVTQLEHVTEIPEGPGTYVVVRESDDPPRFLAKSPAGRPRGRDSTVPVELLKELWVPGARLVYMGQAEHLPRRVTDLVRFGQGRPTDHLRGRSIWQLEDHDDLLVAWKSDRRYPTPTYREVLAAFQRAYNGVPPFGNRRLR